MLKRKAWALVIGVSQTANGNKFDPAPKKDATRMARFVSSCGFRLLGATKNGAREPAPLIDSAATRAEVTTILTEAATELKRGDMLLVYFSGHGRSVLRRGQTTEGWLLFDRFLFEPRWKQLLREFKPGVRVLVITDCCFTGGFGPPEAVDEVAVFESLPPKVRELMGIKGPVRSRTVTLKVAQTIFGDDHEFEAIDNGLQSERVPKAWVLLLAACQANQSAMSSKTAGVFTSKLLRLVGNGGFKGSYRQLYRKLRRRFKGPFQSPFYWSVGPMGDPFGHEQAFAVEAPMALALGAASPTHGHSDLHADTAAD